MTRLVIFLMGCSIFATSGYRSDAQTVPAVQSDDVFRKEVDKWVQDLESREADMRDGAEANLRKAGPRVLDYLPTIDDRTRGETKERLLRVRKALEKQRVAETAKATRLTLQGKMTISDALKAIEAQTGNTIIDYRDRLNQQADDTQLSLNIQDKPFWEAFDELADTANVTVYSFVGEVRKLAIVAASDTAPPRSEAGIYEGLFRIEPTALTAQRNFRGDSGDILRLTFELLWEPRVLPILIRQDLSEIQAVTDQDESIEVIQTGTRQIPVQAGVASLDLQLPLALPSRDSKTIKSLKGTLIALVPGGNVTFEFRDLVNGRGEEQSRGGLTVLLDDVRRNNGLQQISIRLRFDQAGDSLQSHLDWVENNVVHLVDPNGKRADDPGYERYRESESEIGFRYIFPVDQKDLTGWKLTYTTPAGVAEIPVPYELTDIPLP